MSKRKSITVVYEDQELLIVDKPPNILVIPSGQRRKRTLTDILNQELRPSEAFFRLYPCHRLDRETSGLIIYAKGKSCQRKMMDLFKKRKVHKYYIGFIQGILKKSQGLIDIPIGGRKSITKYRVIKRYREFSVAEIFPLTGRKNQIRLHFKMIGHPLVGESRFAFRKDFSLRFKRVCLQAKGLEFISPFSKKRIKLEIPLAPDLKRFLEKFA